MTWEQKLAALNSLSGLVGGVALHMRKPGDWYSLSGGVDVGNGKLLSSCGGNGPTPEDAVIAHWERVTVELKPDEFLVVNAATDQRRHVRWNGFMWADEPVAA